jgi:hypothetical protein
MQERGALLRSDKPPALPFAESLFSGIPHFILMNKLKPPCGNVREIRIIPPFRGAVNVFEVFGALC